MCVIVVVFPQMWYFCCRLVCAAAGGGPRLRAAHFERDGAAGSRSGAAVRGGPPRQIQGKENGCVFFLVDSLFLLSIKQRARERAGAPQRSKFVHKSQLI